jgi:hypothetical protein
VLIHIVNVFLKEIVQKHHYMIQPYGDFIAKQFIAIVFGFFGAFNVFRPELIVYLQCQFFYEKMAIVFVNVPIEKFHFPNMIMRFIKNPAQGRFGFVFYWDWNDHAVIVHVKFGTYVYAGGFVYQYHFFFMFVCLNFNHQLHMHVCII